MSRRKPWTFYFPFGHEYPARRWTYIMGTPNVLCIDVCRFCEARGKPTLAKAESELLYCPPGVP